MMASIGTEIPTGANWTFEPKYDGVRVLAFASGSSVRLITRNGKDKSHQFPEVTAGVRALARQRKRPFVLDGEIVALADDAPARFQALQGRMHLQGKTDIASQATSTPSALIAFDLLVDGDTVMIDQPWTVRRKRLERFVGTRPPKGVRLGDSAPGDGEKLLARARHDDWEGIIAKRVDSTYQPGKRSRDWLKLKVEFRQEFVVGGYTEPRKTREHLGALLLGYSTTTTWCTWAIPAAASPARASRRWQNGSSDSSESHLHSRPRCARTRRHTGCGPTSWSR
jgi:bifunctional non-homologous end joining protein LigD